jgi:hypothetical protein
MNKNIFGYKNWEKSNLEQQKYLKYDLEIQPCLLKSFELKNSFKRKVPEV